MYLIILTDPCYSFDITEFDITEFDITGVDCTILRLY